MTEGEGVNDGFAGDEARTPERGVIVASIVYAIDNRTPNFVRAYGGEILPDDGTAPLGKLSAHSTAGTMHATNTTHEIPTLQLLLPELLSDPQHPRRTLAVSMNRVISSSPASRCAHRSPTTLALAL